MNITEVLERYTLDEPDRDLLRQITSYITNCDNTDRGLDILKNFCNKSIRESDKFMVVFDDYFTYLYDTKQRNTFNIVFNRIYTAIKNLKYDQKLSIHRTLFIMNGFKKCFKFMPRHTNPYEYNSNSIFTLMFPSDKHHSHMLDVIEFRGIYEILCHNNGTNEHKNIYNYLCDIIISNTGYLHRVPDGPKLTTISLLLCIYDLMILMFVREYIDDTMYLLYKDDDNITKIKHDLVNKFWICDYIVSDIINIFRTVNNGSLEKLKNSLYTNPSTIYETMHNKNTNKTIRDIEYTMTGIKNITKNVHTNVVTCLIIDNMYFQSPANVSLHSTLFKNYYCDIIRNTGAYVHLMCTDNTSSKRDCHMLMRRYGSNCIDHLTRCLSFHNIGLVIMYISNCNYDMFDDNDKNTVINAFINGIKYGMSLMSEDNRTTSNNTMIIFNLINYIMKMIDKNEYDVYETKELTELIMLNIDGCSHVLNDMLTLFEDDNCIISDMEIMSKFMSDVMSTHLGLFSRYLKNTTNFTYLYKYVYMIHEYINRDPEISPFMDQQVYELYQHVSDLRKDIMVCMVEILEDVLDTYTQHNTKLIISTDVYEMITSLSNIVYDITVIEPENNAIDSITCHLVYEPIYLQNGTDSILIDKVTYNTLQIKGNINPFNREPLNDEEIMSYNATPEIKEKIDQHLSLLK